MASSILLSDNGVSSGSAGIKTSGGNDGVLLLQTTTAGGSATTAVTIDTAQNVGVGTTSPSSYYANQIVAYKASRAGITVATDSAGIGDLAFANGTTGNQTYRGVIRYDHSADYMSFWTGATERARIDSSGNLLVGTTSSTSGGKFTFLASTNNEVGEFRVGTNGYGVVMYNASNTRVGAIAINSGSTTYSTTSDYRLKENIVPMTGALSAVALLKPCTYTWKETGEASQGFIAHELQSVVPECVTGAKDAVDADGNPVYQGIDTSFLVATLTAAIQEQQAIITAQQTALTTLTARIEALEGAKA